MIARTWLLPSIFLLMVILVAIVMLLGGCDIAYAFTTEASYYTVASCAKEGTSGICANGERLNDEALICASWDYPFGTKLRITNIHNNRKNVVVRVTDRGPSKRLYKRGRRIDLSRAAFQRIANVKDGMAQVTVERIGE